MDKAAVTHIRDEILQAVLPHVAFDGWHWDTITAAAKGAGYEPAMARAVFPGRMIDVLDAFADWADRQMLMALEKTDPQSLRIRDRVSTALLWRYQGLQPHKEAVRQSSAFWLIPHRQPRVSKIVWRTADRIWDWAGDTATDYNRYTKRGLLSGIIISTTLAWFDDNSEDLDRTKAFLDRRIENVMQLNKLMGKVKKAS